MAFPFGWPPRPASGRRSIRFFTSGTATANWSDNAYLFIDNPGANTFQPMPFVRPGGETTLAKVGDRNIPGSPMGTGAQPSDVTPGDPLGQQKALIWAQTIRIFNDGGADLEISFAAPDDPSTLVQGIVKINEQVTYRNRFEAGIAVRGAGALFRIEAW